MWIVLMGLGSAFAADCPEPKSARDLADLTSEATIAFAAMDDEGFQKAAVAALSTADCLSEVVTTRDVLDLHSVAALRAFMDGDDEATTKAFKAALLADPEFQLSTRLAPQGGRLRGFFDAASSSPTPKSLTLDVPSGQTMWIDGEATEAQHVGVPSLVQIGTDRREVAWSRYLGPSVRYEAPRLGGAAVADARTDDPEEPDEFDGMDDLDGKDGSLRGKPAPKPREPKAPRDKSGGGAKIGPMWIVAGASGLTAAGLFGGSIASRSSFDNNPTRGGFAATNGTYWASVGMAAVTAGLVTVAIVGGKKR